MILRNLPNSHPIQSVNFTNLNGGLNLHDLDYLLPPNQSAEMRNLWWKDGVLQGRDGQECKLAAPSSMVVGEDAIAYTCFERLFHDRVFAHVGTKICYCEPGATTLEWTPLITVPTIRGTFFRFNEFLMYKTKGAYIQISYDDGEDTFSAADLLSTARVSPTQLPSPSELDTVNFIPTIVINAHPESGSGEMYQPENRLSSVKTVWYNVPATAVGTYQLPVKAGSAPTLMQILYLRPNGTTYEDVTNTATCNTDGKITFTNQTDWPQPFSPARNNTVQITYSLANPDARTAISDCRYAHVFKSASDLCIFMAGSEAQPNAVFWNSNTEYGMDPSYFPISYYNLCGDASDPVRGFGTQYSDYMVFKERQIGKLNYTTVDLEGRTTISFTYQIINSVFGCDLPWTIQTIENNLVFCNTYQGVHMVQSASPAYENNVILLSKNVNGTDDRSGLLQAIKNTVDPDLITSHDDGVHYWLSSTETGEAFVWNYEISTPSKPSWFYFTNIMAKDYLLDDPDVWHIDGTGQLYRFERTWRDVPFVGASGDSLMPIDKFYAFPPQYFGTYDRVKDIMYVLFSVRADANTETGITYVTDYGSYNDKTNIVTRQWSLVPRNLSFRMLAPMFFAYTAKRVPPARHIQHFGIHLENNKVGQDLAILSVQIFYRFTGRMR